MDYLMGVLLIASPWIFDFYQGGAETWVPVILGAGVILYSLLTRYEYSAAKMIPMKTHIILDIAGGVFLAASPWIFDFHDDVYMPHLIFGVLEIAAALMTETSTERATDRDTITGTHRHAH